MDKQHIIKDLKDESQRYAKAAEILEQEWNDALKSVAKAKYLTQKMNGRMQQIIEKIQKNGPMKAKELERAGIPRGTVVSYLTRKNGFKSDGAGRWDY